MSYSLPAAYDLSIASLPRRRHRRQKNLTLARDWSTTSARVAVQATSAQSLPGLGRTPASTDTTKDADSFSTRPTLVWSGVVAIQAGRLPIAVARRFRGRPIRRVFASRTADPNLGYELVYTARPAWRRFTDIAFSATYPRTTLARRIHRSSIAWTIGYGGRVGPLPEDFLRRFNEDEQGRIRDARRVSPASRASSIFVSRNPATSRCSTSLVEVPRWSDYNDIVRGRGNFAADVLPGHCYMSRTFEDYGGPEMWYTRWRRHRHRRSAASSEIPLPDNVRATILVRRMGAVPVVGTSRPHRSSGSYCRPIQTRISSAGRCSLI
jgi:hypothetical protein